MVNDLTALQKKIGVWQAKTFPNQTATAKLNHLKREVLELVEDHDPEEAADCLILLLGHAEVCGYDLYSEAVKKFEKIQTRKWGSPDHEGVIQHIQED